MSLITFSNLRRLLDLIRILAHMYRKRKTTKRHVKPEKRNYWLKKKKRPDDERNPDRPESYIFKRYDRMVRSTPFLHHLGQRDIDTLVDMVSKMYTKDGTLFMSLLDFSKYRFDIEWIWDQMGFDHGSPRSDEADDRNSTNQDLIQEELKTNNDVDMVEELNDNDEGNDEKDKAKSDSSWDLFSSDTSSPDVNLPSEAVPLEAHLPSEVDLPQANLPSEVVPSEVNLPSKVDRPQVNLPSEVVPSEVNLPSKVNLRQADRSDSESSHEEEESESDEN